MPDPDDDLPPLTLRQKAQNRRFNKMLDRLSAVPTALGLTLVAYGGIRELLDGSAGESPRWVLVVVSAILGLAMAGAATYFSFMFHRRED